MPQKLWSLGWVFVALSLMAVGGGSVILPPMHHFTVNEFNWINDNQFRSIYALGQVAPGPNMLMVIVIGYHVAGALGAIVVGICFFLPDCMLTLLVNRFWHHLKDSPWKASIQHGMAPVTIGLMLSGVFSIAKITVLGDVTFLIAALVAALLYWTHLKPLRLILIGGLLNWLLA